MPSVVDVGVFRTIRAALLFSVGLLLLFLQAFAVETRNPAVVFAGIALIAVELIWRGIEDINGVTKRFYEEHPPTTYDSDDGREEATEEMTGAA